MVKETEKRKEEAKGTEEKARASSTPKEGDKEAKAEEKDPVKELEQQLKKAEEKSLYLSAEFQNFRKRMEKEKIDFLKYGHEEFIRDLLFVQDNFERALNHADKDTKDPKILEGLQMIMGQFSEVLEKQGVRPVKALGKSFDPNFHEAVAEEEVEEKEAGVIISEHLKGYTLHDRVLRAAKVVVAKDKAESKQKEV